MNYSVSTRTAACIELLKKHGDLSSALYDVLAENYGEELAESMMEQNFRQKLSALFDELQKLVMDSITDNLDLSKGAEI